MADGGEIAIGAVERGALSAVLTAIHRGGFGNVTRVLDPQRGEILGQLRRAGVKIPEGFSLAQGNRVAVVINASARVANAVDLLRRNGADATWVARRAGAAPPPTFGDLVSRSRTRPAASTDSLAD